MWSSSISAMESAGARSGGASATASRRVWRGSALAGAGLRQPCTLPVLQLARERAVGPGDHRLALVDAVEDLDVGAAGDADLDLAHLGLAVLVEHEQHLDRPGLAGGRHRGRLLGLGGRGAAGAGGCDQAALARRAFLLLLLRL